MPIVVSASRACSPVSTPASLPVLSSARDILLQAPMPATAPAAPAGGRRELEVEAVWHEQVGVVQARTSVMPAQCLLRKTDPQQHHLPHRLQLHQSKVSVLAFSADATCLWSGCDAAAPTRKPHGDEASVVAVSCKVGRIPHTAW